MRHGNVCAACTLWVRELPAAPRMPSEEEWVRRLRAPAAVGQAHHHRSRARGAAADHGLIMNGLRAGPIKEGADILVGLGKVGSRAVTAIGIGVRSGPTGNGALRRRNAAATGKHRRPGLDDQGLRCVPQIRHLGPKRCWVFHFGKFEGSPVSTHRRTIWPTSFPAEKVVAPHRF